MGKRVKKWVKEDRRFIRPAGKELPFPDSSSNPFYVMWAVSSQGLKSLADQLQHRKLQAKRREGEQRRREIKGEQYRGKGRGQEKVEGRKRGGSQRGRMDGGERGGRRSGG